MLHRVGIARLFLARWVELNFRLLLGMMHDVVVRVVVRHGSLLRVTSAFLTAHTYSLFHPVPPGLANQLVLDYNALRTFDG